MSEFSNHFNNVLISWLVNYSLNIYNNIVQLFQLNILHDYNCVNIENIVKQIVPQGMTLSKGLVEKLKSINL